MTKDRYEIRFSGHGGQGVILAAVVLAESIAMDHRKHVCQTQSYGPEARGGSSKADVVISDQDIDYPKAIKLDLLLAMNQSGCDDNFHELKAEGLLVVDSNRVDRIPTRRSLSLPFSQMAREKLGNLLAANMIALGAVGYLSGRVSLKHLESAVAAKVPKGTQALNQKALRMGFTAAKKVSLDDLPPSVTEEEDEV